MSSQGLLPWAPLLRSFAHRPLDVAQLGVPAQPALAWPRSETWPASSQGPWEQLAYSLGTRDTDFPGPLMMATAPLQRSGLLPETLSFVRSQGCTTGWHQGG